MCGRNHCLRKHGTYSRGIYDFALGHTEIEILRFYCPGCGQTVSILPDFVLPHKYYSSLVLSVCLYLLFCCECGIGDVSERFNISRSLLTGWLRQFYFNRINVLTILRDYFGISSSGVEVSSYRHSPHITSETLQAFLGLCELVFGGEIASCRGTCDKSIFSCDSRLCSGLFQGAQGVFSNLSFPFEIF